LRFLSWFRNGERARRLGEMRVPAAGVGRQEAPGRLSQAVVRSSDEVTDRRQRVAWGSDNRRR
jgi:hypothetical protein